MNFEIKFIPEATETFDAVIEQLQQRWGERFVTKFRTIVSTKLDVLANTPYLYPIAYSTGVRKCVLHKNCSMFYKVFDDYVLVICFWDNRQDPLY